VWCYRPIDESAIGSGGLASLTMRSFADYILGGFVRSQPEISRMPKLAVPRPLGEADFSDEGGLHPRYAIVPNVISRCKMGTTSS
jgi:hypothetical protein